MCGIIGYFSKNPLDEDFEIIKEIFKNSKIRGLHAFGFTALLPTGLETVKCHNLEDILNNLDFFKTLKPKILIGHNRYSTSGDYKKHINNQPVYLAKEGISLVFNGVISMKHKKEYEILYNESYETENDGEIILRKYLKNENITDFINNSNISFAGMILTESKKELLFLKNWRRPAYYSKKNNSIFIASTKDILKKSGLDSIVSFNNNELINVELL